jgi:tetratricopeptide (TPR) repeat protein
MGKRDGGSTHIDALNRMKHRLILFLLIATACRMPVQAINPPIEPTDTSLLWVTGQKLQAQKQFLLAILEYNRLLYEFPEYPSKNRVYLRLAQCYDSIKQPEQAHRFYEEALQSTPKGEPIAQWLLLFNARNHIAKGKFAPALAELYSLDTPKLNNEQADIYHLLAAVAHHHLGSTHSCKQHLLQLDVDGERIAEYERSVSASERPNPNAALIMSAILPGAGQLYSGFKREALNSFTINAIFLTLTAQSIRYAGTLDLIVAVLPWFQRYYVGGFNRASILARQKQMKKKLDCIEQV